MKLIMTEKELCEYCYRTNLISRTNLVCNNPCDICLAFKLCETFTANMVVSPKNFVSGITRQYKGKHGDRKYYYEVNEKR